MSKLVGVEGIERRSDANNPIVLKARAAQNWCKIASKVSIDNQSAEWEYLVISDKDVKENSQLGFEGLVGIARDNGTAGAEWGGAVVIEVCITF